jgi:hypothetical protein
MNYWDSILKVLENFDLTEIFKTKGKLKRWSAKRSVGGVIATTAVAEIAKNGISAEAIILAAIGVLPLCLSFFEKN